MVNDVTSEYFFIENDLRFEIDPTSYPVWPYIRRDDPQNLNWWSGGPVTPPKPVGFTADPESPNDIETFARMTVSQVVGAPLLRPELARPLRDIAPDDAQFIPSYVRTTRGPFEFEENWLYLHLWKLRDLADTERSTLEWDDPEADNYESIVLDDAKIDAIPPDQRAILRFASKEDDFIIYHKDVIDQMFQFGVKGALIVPLSLYAPFGTWLRPNLDAINALNDRPE